MRSVVVLVACLLSLPQIALARRPITIRVPKFEVAAGRNREVCTFVRIPAKHAMDLAGIVMVNRGGNASFATHHLIVYQYTRDWAPLRGLEDRPVDSTACLDFGPGDSTALRVVATSQAVEMNEQLPRGLAIPLEPTGDEPSIGLLINSHWINGSDRAQKAQVKVKLVPARKRQVKKELKPIFEVVANAFLDVAPGVRERRIFWDWGPGLQNLGGALGGAENPTGPACVTSVIGHMHRRGTLFTSEFVDRTGAATEIYRQTNYAEPHERRLDPPLLVHPGEHIRYYCTHDNATDPRLGCEEEAGVAPGRSVLNTIPRSFFGDAAKLCTTAGPSPAECPATDPGFPGKTFTGNCVQANLVFGFTSEDDMCILPGFYYDGDAAAAPGHECDLE